MKYQGWTSCLLKEKENVSLQDLLERIHFCKRRNEITEKKKKKVVDRYITILFNYYQVLFLDFEQISICPNNPIYSKYRNTRYFLCSLQTSSHPASSISESLLYRNCFGKLKCSTWR